MSETGIEYIVEEKNFFIEQVFKSSKFGDF